MIYSEPVSLRRLLKRQAAPLLEAFEALLVGCGLALLELDGTLFIQAGHWPRTALSQLLTVASLDQLNTLYRRYPLRAGSQNAGTLVVYGDSAVVAEPAEQALHRSLQLLLDQVVEEREIVNDTLHRYRELTLLYRVGETIGTALNPELIPPMVLQESQRVIQADVGVEVGVFVLRRPDTSGENDWESKASFGSPERVTTLLEVMRLQIGELLENGRPAILTNLPVEPGARYSRSPYSTVLWAPLKTPKRVLGGILLGRLAGEAEFTASDEKLLTALALQSALALENAQLFAQTDEQLAQRVKELMQEVARRQQAEAALRQYALELEVRNKELDAFAHTVAHDLQGPLANLIGYATILQDSWFSLPAEQLQEILKTIAHAGYKMSNIIDEILLLASVRKEEAQITTLEISQIIGEVQRRLNYMIKEYQAKIIMPDSWPVALGYAPWVEEIWANYFSNAIKYGGRPPHLEVGATLQEDGQIRFWIRDNGKGLTSEEQSRLFIPFTKLNQIRAKGHGLGLSIVQRIVEKLGGQVGVESQVGQGSLFYFTLPGA